ncbi:hypothetical protein SAMN05444853_1359 [Pasteurella skyensis]|uniref:Uncharacterized protein n=1 Tax=Phocoenobacter skyensis TaxID=97481 RepID=A0A1H8A4L3_9PAST|nr:hypothetical protein SAMN05444853_1359 [Pasteurella skyensis]
MPKILKPQARVIYNDFDNYTEALQYIDDINVLRELLLKQLIDIEKGSKIPKSLKPKIIKNPSLKIKKRYY